MYTFKTKCDLNVQILNPYHAHYKYILYKLIYIFLSEIFINFQSSYQNKHDKIHKLHKKHKSGSSWQSNQKNENL